MITAAKAKVEAVKKGLKAARRAALDSGYNLGDLDEAMAMREQEPETVQATIMRKAQYAFWMGIAPEIKQGDLFASADVGEDTKWYDEGREDALLGLPCKGERYDLTVDAGQERQRGWEAGHARRTELQEAQLEQFKANAKAEKDKTDKRAAKAAEKVKEAEATVN